MEDVISPYLGKEHKFFGFNGVIESSDYNINIIYLQQKLYHSKKI